MTRLAVSAAPVSPEAENTAVERRILHPISWRFWVMPMDTIRMAAWTQEMQAVHVSEFGPCSTPWT